MDTSHEEVGPRVASGCFTVIIVAIVGRWATDQMLALFPVLGDYFRLTESPCGRSVRHSYHDHHGSCRRALTDSRRHAWGEEKHFDRARKLVLLHANINSRYTRKNREYCMRPV